MIPGIFTSARVGLDLYSKHCFFKNNFAVLEKHRTAFQQGSGESRTQSKRINPVWSRFMSVTECSEMQQGVHGSHQEGNTLFHNG